MLFFARNKTPLNKRLFNRLLSDNFKKALPFEQFNLQYGMFFSNHRKFLFDSNRILSILIILIIGASSSCAKADHTPILTEGTLSYTDKSPAMVRISGEAFFIPDAFIDPDEIAEYAGPAYSVGIPGYWNRYRHLIPDWDGMGYGTFFFTVTVSDTEMDYSVLIPTMGTAYRIFINSELVCQTGTPGTNRSETEPYYHSEVMDIHPQSNDIHFVIQVANFHHSRGGIWEPIYFGDRDSVRAYRLRSIIFESFIIGIMFIMMIYHLMIFFLRRFHKASLYFGLACWGILLRTMTIGQYTLTLIFPEAPWWLSTRFEYISLYVVIFSLIALQQTLFPREMNRTVNRIIYVANIVSIIFILVTPASIFTYTLWTLIFIGLFASIDVITALIRSTIRKRRMAGLLLIAYIVFVLAFVNDLLFANSILLTFGWTIYLAQFLLVMFESYIIADRFNKTFNTIEELSASLEKRVSDRTKDLENEINMRKNIEQELRNGENRLASILQYSPYAIMITSLQTGEILFANKKTVDMFKVAISEIFFHGLKDFFYVEEDFEYTYKLIYNNDSIRNFEIKLKTFEGMMFWGNLSTIRMDYSGEVAVLSFISDITLNKLDRAEAELQSAYLMSLFESINEAVVILDMDGFVDRVNSRFIDLFGYSEDEVKGHNLAQLITDEKSRIEAESIKRSTIEGETVIIDTLRHHKNGHLLDVSLMSAPIIMKKERIGIYEVYRDIRKRKEQEKQLKESLEKIRELSLTDEMTACYNRRGFMILADEQVKIAERNHNHMLLLFLDLDGLKWINDNLGHELGDQAIKDTADLLHYTFRKPDIIARIGGDEFIVLIIDAESDHIEKISERLMKNMTTMREKRKHTYYFDASFGFEEYDPDQSVTVEELIKRADYRMYENKRSKKKTGEHSEYAD